jgi:hypothetical protein
MPVDATAPERLDRDAGPARSHDFAALAAAAKGGPALTVTRVSE